MMMTTSIAYVQDVDSYRVKFWDMTVASQSEGTIVFTPTSDKQVGFCLYWSSRDAVPAEAQMKQWASWTGQCS